METSRNPFNNTLHKISRSAKNAVPKFTYAKRVNVIVLRVKVDMPARDVAFLSQSRSLRTRQRVNSHAFSERFHTKSPRTIARRSTSRSGATHKIKRDSQERSHWKTIAKVSPNFERRISRRVLSSSFRHASAISTRLCLAASFPPTTSLGPPTLPPLNNKLQLSWSRSR